MWKCFRHPCWSKAGRLFWLRAHGFWDRRLDELGLTSSHGRPYGPSTRVLRLPSHASAAIGRLVSDVSELGPTRLAGPAALSLRDAAAFRTLHAILHNLFTVAALVGRLPVVPRVPCHFIETVQEITPETPADRSRFGVTDASVMAGGERDAPMCQLMPAAWLPPSSATTTG